MEILFYGVDAWGVDGGAEIDADSEEADEGGDEDFSRFGEVEWVLA